MASILKVDTITGVATAGSIAITGEGNSTTTNLQQGLAKAWANIDGSGTVSFRDSFNTSGLTDNGTGDYTTSFSTSFGNVNYSFTYCGAQDGAETTYQMKSASMAVGTHQIQLKNAAGTVTDRDFICGTFHGDLA
jgi:hypothetical protein|tara:strand:+ start:309 stop:713 length:405 start_codon:yes stop_codon:yes gene_type:complete